MNDASTPSERGIPKAAFLPALARGVLDALPNPLFVVDLRGQVLVRNLAHKRLLARLGLTPTFDQLSIEQLASLFEDGARFRAFVQVAQEQTESEHEAELRLLPSGRVLSVRIAPVRLPDAGTVARLVSLREVERDVTPQQTALTEVRTPLTAVRGYLELAAHRDDDEATRRQHLAVALEQCDRLSAVLDDLLGEPERS